MPKRLPLACKLPPIAPRGSNAVSIPTVTLLAPDVRSTHVEADLSQDTPFGDAPLLLPQAPTGVNSAPFTNALFPQSYAGEPDFNLVFGQSLKVTTAVAQPSSEQIFPIGNCTEGTLLNLMPLSMDGIMTVSNITVAGGGGVTNPYTIQAVSVDPAPGGISVYAFTASSTPQGADPYGCRLGRAADNATVGVVVGGSVLQPFLSGSTLDNVGDRVNFNLHVGQTQFTHVDNVTWTIQRQGSFAPIITNASVDPSSGDLSFEVDSPGTYVVSATGGASRPTIVGDISTTYPSAYSFSVDNSATPLVVSGLLVTAATPPLVPVGGTSTLQVAQSDTTGQFTWPDVSGEYIWVFPADPSTAFFLPSPNEPSGPIAQLTTPYGTLSSNSGAVVQFTDTLVGGAAVAPLNVVVCRVDAPNYTFADRNVDGFQAQMAKLSIVASPHNALTRSGSDDQKTDNGATNESNPRGPGTSCPAGAIESLLRRGTTGGGRPGRSRARRAGFRAHADVPVARQFRRTDRNALGL